jgi:hypothetical protein
MIAWAALLAAVACGPNLRGTVDAETVRAAVERVAVPYVGEAPPAALVDRLSASDVVVVGEHHGISAHGGAVAGLVSALHPHGLRAVLLEYPQATTWLLDGYARGMLSDLDGAARATYGALLDGVRALNVGLESAQRVRVYAIDVNPRAEEAMPPLRGLMHQLGRPDLLANAVEAVERGEPRGDVFEDLAAALGDDAAGLAAAWGDARYRAVVDLVDAELRSIRVRALRGERQRSDARERVMHELVERYRSREGGLALVNVGAYHAQRTSRDGTVDVWLAERLGDGVYSLLVTPTRGELPRGDAVRSIDVLADSPPNELLRVTVERHGHGLVFVPLDDPLFRDERVVLTHHGRIDTEPPGRVFDGVLLLGEVRAIRR